MIDDRNSLPVDGCSTRPLSRLGDRNPTTLDVGTPVSEVAAVMQRKNLGAVVLTKEDRPVGILTDRDLVLRVIAPGRAASSTLAEEVMSAPLVTIADHVSALDAAAKMRERKVRRLPITGADGRLSGVVEFDDLVHHFGRATEQLSEVVVTYPIPHHGG